MGGVLSMTNVPHFDFPFKFDNSGHPQTVEQDSDKDILNCVNAVLRTVRGSRLYVPDFGIDDFTFNQSPIDEALLTNQILESEPRADILIEQNLDELIDAVIIGVNGIGQ